MHKAEARQNTLTYDSASNCLELDGYELQSGDRMEVSVFGYWIPGEVALDQAGWYLLTLDGAAIRLHSALSARFFEPRTSDTPIFSSSRKDPPQLLIVDDDPALLQALPQTVALRLPGVAVETSDSAQDALSRLHARDYDAIVTDIKMPGMDGLELLEKIRELRPETPTLLITGHGEHDLAIRALRGGAYEYLQKPIERDAFVAAIRRALQTRHLRRQIVEQQLALELHAKSLEQLVQQRTRELVEANATKDKVISIVSHELKEPLMHLKDMTHLLSRKLEGSYVEEIVIQGFADVEQALIRTEVLVQELLETARIDTTLFILHRERYNLVALCQSVLEECTAANHIALTRELPGLSLEVEIDVERIRHLLTLLFSNVCKSLTKNTSVTVTLHQVGHEAMLIVGDISLRPELGVGFYISRKIIERHGGRLDVQYFPGNRCTYFIALPLLIDPSTEDADAVSPAPLTQAVWIISYT